MTEIGLYIIGDEILSGRRKDKQLTAVRKLLFDRGLTLSWVQILSDDLDLLVKRFRESLAGNALVFSTGGIGGTPDDLTRLAAARASQRKLVIHQKGLGLLKALFGDDLSPERYRMVELPEGSDLIPNPINQIPGFSLRQHYFMPGFPEMAQPMIEWILDNKHQALHNKNYLELAIQVYNTRESQLTPLMESLLQQYPDLKLFSLPALSAKIELGFKGPAMSVKQAMIDLQNELNERQIEWYVIV